METLGERMNLFAMRWLWLLMYKWLFTWTICFPRSRIFSRIFYSCSFLIFFNSLLCCIMYYSFIMNLRLVYKIASIYDIESRKILRKNWAFPITIPLSIFPKATNFLFSLIVYLSKIKFCSQNSPIVFGSIWYAGMPQWAGGGVVRWSPLWQKNGVNPILLACKKNKASKKMC